MEGILRNPAEKDRNFVGEDGKIERFLNDNKKTVRELFDEELANQEQIIAKQNLSLDINVKKPFAAKVAREEFNEHWANQRKQALKEKGKLDTSDFTKPKTDWKRYSDLSNFEVLDEGERFDDNATKNNPGLHIMSKWKKFKFKGYHGTYTLMEDGPSSIKRAREKGIREDLDIKKSIQTQK